ISAIVTESTNPDFVTSCFATLGISTSSTLDHTDDSSERRMAQFRQILERDIHAAFERSRRHRRTFSSFDEQNRIIEEPEDSEEEEEDEWMGSLTEAEIEALWTPQPVI